VIGHPLSRCLDLLLEEWRSSLPREVNVTSALKTLSRQQRRSGDASKTSSRGKSDDKRSSNRNDDDANDGETNGFVESNGFIDSKEARDLRSSLDRVIFSFLGDLGNVNSFNSSGSSRGGGGVGGGGGDGGGGGGGGGSSGGGVQGWRAHFGGDPLVRRCRNDQWRLLRPAAPLREGAPVNDEAGEVNPVVTSNNLHALSEPL